MPDKIESKVATENHNARSSLVPLPEPSGRPLGVSADLWADIHWFPATVQGISGTPSGTHLPLAQWVFSQPYADHESCRALERGLGGGYGIEWEHPPQSFVFYGAAEFAEIEECAARIVGELGGTARMAGDVLRIELAGTESAVQFARRGKQLVAIVDDGRLGAPEDARSGDLGRSDSLTRLLGEVDTEASEMGWSVSRRDLTQTALGIASLGHAVDMRGPGERSSFHFLFADAAAAGEAGAAARPFVKEAEEFLGIGLLADLAEVGEVLTVSLDLREFFIMAASEPEKLEAMQAKLARLQENTEG